MAEHEEEIDTKVGYPGMTRIGWFAVLMVLVLDGGCRRNRDQLEEEIPDWLKHRTTYTERTIQPDWFKAELKKIFAGSKRVRILQGNRRAVVGVENSPEKIAALVSSLEIDGPTVEGPGRVCRCIPDLYLEFDTLSGKETLSPVCARRLRLGTLETGIKWPDPYLTRAALDSLRTWVEEHGVAFECCGERPSSSRIDAAAQPGIAPDDRSPSAPARRSTP